MHSMQVMQVMKVMKVMQAMQVMQVTQVSQVMQVCVAHLWVDLRVIYKDATIQAFCLNKIYFIL